MVSTAESSGAWAEVVAHDAGFEFPDVIGFAEAGPDGRGWTAGPWAAEGRLHRPAMVAKPGGGTRVLSVLDPAVHARYRALVGRVAGSIERTLGPEVSAGRVLHRGRVARGCLPLEPWRCAWRRHLRAVRGLGASGGALVRLDVRDCFGSIRAEVVRESLGRAGVDPGDATALSGLLRGFEEDGIRGLPVGPEPSAVLANLALGRADQAIRDLGLPFVRWCDDVTVGLGRADAGVVVDAWTEALRPLGLRPAPEKVRLVDGHDRPRASLARIATAPAAGSRSRMRTAEAGPADRSIEHAVASAAGADPHEARARVAMLGALGGRTARAALRHVRVRAPYLVATAEWGLRR
jgi:hypothetical protein